MMTATRIHFPLAVYVRIVTRMFTGPGALYGELETTGPEIREAFTFLIFASLISAGAGILVHRPPEFMAVFGILFANAVGMCFFAVMVGYIIMIMGFGRKSSFLKLFRIYALASGTTLLLSWIPFSLMFTELWKWWLIFVGLTRGGVFNKKEGALVLILSIAVIVLFFRSLLAVLA